MVLDRGGGGGYITSAGTLPSNTIAGWKQWNSNGNANNIGNNFLKRLQPKGGSGGSGSYCIYIKHFNQVKHFVQIKHFTVTASSAI